MYKLVIQDDEGKTTIVPLVRDEITVGRKEGNTIRLTERNVSRRHARIVRANGAIAIEDLESYNGVRVNGARIDGRHPLTLKDRVQIGDYLIEIKNEGEEALTENEHHTEPIENEVAASSSSSIPVIQDLADPDAKTRPMQAQFIPPDEDAADSADASTPASGRAASAEVADPMAAADTEIMAAATPQPARTARLIALSANFAGVEFPLTEPAMVIGRTDENDIVIGHRSISRNHAKIVRENSHYAIVDLQSSNGVRVNGEEYGKVELRRGDLVDLGHVRLRFADPDDDYVFAPEDVNDVTTSGGKGMWYALLAVLVLVSGIGIFTLMGNDGNEQESVLPGPPQTGPTPNTMAVTADAADAPDVDTDDPALLLERVKRAVEDRKWAHAHVAADKLLEKEPGNAEAKGLKETAQRETVNEVRYQEMMKAIESKAYRDVPRKLAEIDESSVYFDQAKTAHDEALEDYVRDEVMPEAASLLAARKCSQLQTLETKTRQQWAPAAEQVNSMVDKCRAPTVRPPRPPPPPPPPPQNEKSFDELMTEAKDAAKAGQYGKAQRLCSDALKIKPGDQDAVSVCGIAACGQTNTKAAKRYHKMAIGERKQQIVQICLLKGIDILR